VGCGGEIFSTFSAQPTYVYRGCNDWIDDMPLKMGE